MHQDSLESAKRAIDGLDLDQLRFLASVFSLKMMDELHSDRKSGVDLDYMRAFSHMLARINSQQ